MHRRWAVSAVISLSGFATAQQLDCAANQQSTNRVVWGKNNTLFLTSYDLYTGLPTEKYLSNFAQVSKNLAAQGIKLVVVPIPTKGVVSATDLNPADPVQKGYDPEIGRREYQQLIERLNRAGVTAVDLLTPALATPGFYTQYDWHWTPEGARASAKAVAQAIKKLPVAKGLPAQRFTTTAAGTAKLGGYQLSTLEKACGQTTGLTQTAQLYKTEPVQASSDLLGSDEPEVVVVGTSFSQQPQWNFTGFLKDALGTDVLNESITAGGVHSAIQTYLLGDAFATRKPKVLIWEFGADRFRDDMSEQQQWPQLVAATRVACTEGRTFGPVAFKGTTDLAVDPPLAAGQYDVYASLTDLSTKLWSVFPNKDNKLGVTLYRNQYMPNKGKFVVPLNVTEKVNSLRLYTNGNPTGTVSLKLCKR